MTRDEFIKMYKHFKDIDANIESDLNSVIESEIKDVDLLISSEIEVSAREMFLNMQYYMEYCQMNGYVTPQEWIEKHKHF